MKVNMTFFLRLLRLYSKIPSFAIDSPTDVDTQVVPLSTCDLPHDLLETLKLKISCTNPSIFIVPLHLFFSYDMIVTLVRILGLLISMFYIP